MGKVRGALGLGYGCPLCPGAWGWGRVCQHGCSERDLFVSRDLIFHPSMFALELLSKSLGFALCGLSFPEQFPNLQINQAC